MSQQQQQKENDDNNIYDHSSRIIGQCINETFNKDVCCSNCTI
eukprot:UN06055